jgi:hypothetical protein
MQPLITSSIPHNESVGNSRGKVGGDVVSSLAFNVAKMMQVPMLCLALSRWQSACNGKCSISDCRAINIALLRFIASSFVMRPTGKNVRFWAN